MLRIVTEFVDLVAMKRIEIQSFDLWPDCQGFNSRSECRIITAVQFIALKQTSFSDVHSLKASESIFSTLSGIVTEVNA